MSFDWKKYYRKELIGVMRPLFLVVLISIFSLSTLQAQQFRVTYDTPGFSTNNSGDQEFDFSLVNNGDINGTGTIVVNNIPTSVNIRYFEIREDFGEVEFTCNGFENVSINSSSNECFSETARFDFSATCVFNAGGTDTRDLRGDFFIMVEPILSFENSSSPITTSSPYCQDDNITLVASPDFNSYRWQYRIGAGSWINFTPPGSENSRTFGLSDIFGSNVSSALSRNITFRYSVGNCDITSINTVRGPYVFNPLPAIATTSSFTPETCFQDQTSQIRITGTSRPEIGSETFEYQLFRNGNRSDVIYSGDAIINANEVSGGLGASSTYEVLIISELDAASTGCGVPNFVSIPFTGPTSEISSASATTSTPQVCDATATVNGSSLVSGETGFWSVVNGTGTFQNANSPSTSVSNLSNGVNTFRWTITQQPAPVCIASDQVTITRIAVTNATAGANQTVCAASATLGGNTPASGENGTWTLVSGSGSFANPNLRNTIVSGLGLGNNVFQWTIRDNGDFCSTNDQVTINFTNLTVPDAGIDQQACNTDVVLNANTVSGGETGTWSLVSGSGTFANDNNAVTTVSGLTVGTNIFRWTITDNGANCPSQNDEVSVVLSDLSVTEIVASRQQPSCFGEDDGSITFIGNGGVGIPSGLDYEFTLSNGEQMFANAGQQVTFSGLSAGSYSLTIEDDLCVRSSQTIVLSNPAAIAVSESISDFNGIQISCNGENDGQIILDVSGGNGGFTYSWSNGATTKDLNNLTAGTYTVTITDVNDCQTQQTYTLNEPFSIAGTTSVTNVNCNGEANANIDLDVTGGIAPYTYLWSTGASSQDIGMLTQGTYSVTITDANSCTVQVNNINVTQPEVVDLTVDDQQDVDCNGDASGQITLNGTGGTGNKTYSQNGTDFQDSPVFSGLIAGNYTFFVRDVNGCDDQVNALITEPTLLSSSVTNQIDATCNEANGSALANPNGGTGSYSFDWRDNNNQQVSTTAQLTNVSGGIYTVTITDQNGCTTINTAVISSTDGAQVTAQGIVATSCFNTNDGQATLDIVGATPFVINWENGETGFTALALAPGDNNVSITDGNNCTTVEVVNIPASQPIVATIQNTTIPTCDDSSDGAITLDIAGGTGTYTFLWSNGATTSDLNNIPAGEYTVTITDTNDCILTTDFNLQGVEPLTIEIVNTIAPTCNGDTDGFIEIKAAGGNGGYTYLWNNNVTSPTQTDIAAGDYQVTVTDNQGCNETFDVNLPDTAPLEIDLGGDKVVCTGSVLNIAAPIDNAAYLWTSSTGFTSTQQQVTLEQEGTYTLQVTNADGCSASDSFRLTASDDLLQADFLMVSEAYTGDTVVIIDISWPIPELLSWDYGTDQINILTQNQDFSEVIFNTPGAYQVSIQTNLGDCFDIEGQTINILDRADKPDNGGRIADSSKPLIKNFKVYPNPNDGRFEIEIQLNQVADIDLNLIDLQGNQSILQINDSGKDTYNIPVNIPQIQPGIYLLSLNVNKENKVLRIVVR